MTFYKFFSLVSLSLAFFLQGCELLVREESPAPVTSKTHRHGQRQRHSINQHKVRQGETLYEIAFKYGLDYRDIAKANHLSTPYKIYPGQHLALSSGTKIKVMPLIAKKSEVKLSKAQDSWIWPVEGHILKRYKEEGENINKGIDIAGNFGMPVLATQAGKVVYAGEGLRGYGKLVIIKHSDEFLSAYAHNHEILVKEGSDISAGQKIAHMGKSETDTVQLHFEIRQRGKPVDPLRFLPTL